MTKPKSHDGQRRKTGGGDFGTVLPVDDGATGYVVEFMTLDGEMIAISTLPVDRVWQVIALL